MQARTSSTRILAILLAAVMLWAPAQAQRPLELGGARRLFLDDHLVESVDGVRFELRRPLDEEAVFQFDRSWEGPFSGYSTVIQDGDRYLLYYRGLPEAGGDNTVR